MVTPSFESISMFKYLLYARDCKIESPLSLSLYLLSIAVACTLVCWGLRTTNLFVSFEFLFNTSFFIELQNLKINTKAMLLFAYLFIYFFKVLN